MSYLWGTWGTPGWTSRPSVRAPEVGEMDGSVLRKRFNRRFLRRLVTWFRSHKTPCGSRGHWNRPTPHLVLLFSFLFIPAGYYFPFSSFFAQPGCRKRRLKQDHLRRMFQPVWHWIAFLVLMCRKIPTHSLSNYNLNLNPNPNPQN